MHHLPHFFQSSHSLTLWKHYYNFFLPFFRIDSCMTRKNLVTLSLPQTKQETFVSSVDVSVLSFAASSSSASLDWTKRTKRLKRTEEEEEASTLFVRLTLRWERGKSGRVFFRWRKTFYFPPFSRLLSRTPPTPVYTRLCSVQSVPKVLQCLFSTSTENLDISMPFFTCASIQF